MKKTKLIYWILTGIFSLMILGGISMYIFQHEIASENFTKLGFPTYLIYGMATAKTLGLVAILSRKSQVLKEWAYAGFFFNLLLAASAHLAAGDGEAGGAIVAMLLMFGSYFMEKKAFPFEKA